MMLFVCLHYQADGTAGGLPLPPPPGDFRPPNAADFVGSLGFHALMLFFVVFNVADEMKSQVAIGIPIPAAAPAAALAAKEATLMMLV